MKYEFFAVLIGQVFSVYVAGAEGVAVVSLLPVRCGLIMHMRA